jgi:copper chaperone CopZ
MIGRRRTAFSYLAALVASIGLSNAIALGASPANATYEIIADGMCCQGCAKKVAAQLYAAPGVINVQADVPTRKVTITAKPSPKLTLEKLWNAVEKAKGKPSQLATSQAVYTLMLPDQLKPEEQPAPGVYTLLVADMHDMKQAERIADQLRPIRGIESFSVDLAQGALFVKPAPHIQLSPWALAAAAEQAQESVVALAGPFGRIRIEPVAQQPASAVLSRQPVQGTIQ